MTTAEAIGAALAAALAPLLENLTQRSMNRNMVDTRGIGRPPSFDGSDKSWREWRGKMTAYLYATDDTAEDALKWVDLQGSTITIEALRASLTNNDGEVDEAGVERARAFSRKLYLILSDTCKGGHWTGLRGLEDSASQVCIQDARYQASAASGSVYVETRQLS